VKLLLDTQILLWAAGQPARLSAAARKLLRDPRNELLFSAASLWEIAIKNTLGREDFRVEPRLLRRGLLDNGYTELPITGQHAVSIDVLPPLHKDPFDRLLLAQALTEGLTLLTADAQLARYRGPLRRIREYTSDWKRWGPAALLRRQSCSTGRDQVWVEVHIHSRDFPKALRLRTNFREILQTDGIARWVD
jgi:PIN domain nuclease of toxin-antitoxin system